jgi:hypothetical protein
MFILKSCSDTNISVTFNLVEATTPDANERPAEEKLNPPSNEEEPERTLFHDFNAFLAKAK